MVCFFFYMKYPSPLLEVFDFYFDLFGSRSERRNSKDCADFWK